MMTICFFIGPSCDVGDVIRIAVGKRSNFFARAWRVVFPPHYEDAFVVTRVHSSARTYDVEDAFRCAARTVLESAAKTRRDLAAAWRSM